MYHATKKKVHGLLHPEIVGDKRWDKIINVFIVVLIILNVVAVMLETTKSVERNPDAVRFFHYFDWFSVIIFSIEYLLRVWSSNHEEKYKGKWGRLKYIMSPAALIDLIAIAPSFLHAFIKLDLRVFRMLRLLRFFRLFRLTAYTESAHMINNVFKKRKNELGLSFILAVFLIIIASCIMYFAEHQFPTPEESKFNSIPATIWWAVVSLTTTGYGDMYPLTALGKTLASIIMLSGVAFFALPAGIITAGFIDEFRINRIKKTHTCPHCGEHIEIDDLKNHNDGH
jgi:voltage-gated potassium channel